MMGMAYSLRGVGFSLTWGVMHVIHISHAAFRLLGAYLVYTENLIRETSPLLQNINELMKNARIKPPSRLQSGTGSRSANVRCYHADFHHGADGSAKFHQG